MSLLTIYAILLATLIGLVTSFVTVDPSECDSNWNGTVANECQENDLVPLNDPCNTRLFCVCKNGAYIPRLCFEGRFYNPYTKICEPWPPTNCTVTPTSMSPTTLPTTPSPSSVPTTASTTVVPITPSPSSVMTTTRPTSVPTTPSPSSVMTTTRPTSVPTTAGTTDVDPITSDPSSVMTTTRPTSVPTTAGTTDVDPITSDPSSVMTTTRPTSVPTTPSPTSVMTNTRPPSVPTTPSTTIVPNSWSPSTVMTTTAKTGVPCSTEGKKEAVADSCKMYQVCTKGFWGDAQSCSLGYYFNSEYLDCEFNTMCYYCNCL